MKKRVMCKHKRLVDEYSNKWSLFSLSHPVRVIFEKKEGLCFVMGGGERIYSLLYARDFLLPHT